MFSIYDYLSSQSSERLYGQNNEQYRTDDESVEAESATEQTLIQVNTLSASLVGFISRILIEKSFFQNSQIPADTLLYLANDLIKALVPPKKEVFHMAKEVNIAWKQLKRESLTQEERSYLECPKSIDVPGEIFNGLKYSSMALIGQSFYKSVTSTAAAQLWNHVPHICAYFGLAMGGPKAIAYSINKILQNTTLTNEQQSLVEPWLNMVGRLALGLVPKVHATEQGVHYHYPSLEGHSQTFSSNQATTLHGNTLSFERTGHLETPNGSFEGVYESDFTLGTIYELNEERIRIQVLDKNGIAVPLTFTKIIGLYGPEITVSCENKELEREWTQYFRPKLAALPAPNQNTGEQKLALYERLSCKEGILLEPAQHQFEPTSIFFNRDLHPNIETANFPLLSAFYVVAGLIAGKGIHPTSLTSGIVALLTLSLSKNVEAFIGRSVRKVGQEARVTLGRANEIITTAIQRVENIENKFMLDLGNLGKLWIDESGNELKVLADGIAEGTQATLKIAGYEANVTIAAAGVEARATVQFIREQASITIQEGTNAVREILGEAKIDLEKMVVNFEEKGSLTIKKLGEKFIVVADKTFENFFSKGEVILNIADEKMRLMIQETRDGFHITIQEIAQETRNTSDHILNGLLETAQKLIGVTGNIAKEAGSGFVIGIKNAIWGQSEYERLQQNIQSHIDDKISKQDSRGLLGKLLADVQGQSQENLSSSDKANLYIKLTQYVNDASENQHEKKWLLFFITSIASQDKKLIDTSTNLFGINSKTINYFQTVFLPTVPNEQIRIAFLKNDFDSLKGECIEYLKKYSDHFSELAIDRQKICFPETITSDGTPIWVNGEKICPSKISPVDDTPVGNVIAYASDVVPLGYVRCDGSSYSKDVYKELYEIIGGRYGEQDGNFRVPDYRDLFLRGTSDPSEIGKFYDDATAMPKKPFQISISGDHEHKTLLSGNHNHTSKPAGGHNHNLTVGGNHTHFTSEEGKHNHTSSESGGHKHIIENAGKHKHTMSKEGEHKHDNYGFHYEKVVSDSRSSENQNVIYINYHGKPKLKEEAGIKPAGQHEHNINEDGSHQHEMGQAGIHDHQISEAGTHFHNLSSADPHTHDMSLEAPHTHGITTAGEHGHDIPKSGEHNHEIVGGDEETRPKNMKVAYLIKAKPTVIATEQVKELQEQVQKLLHELESHPTQDHFIMLSVVVAALAVKNIFF